MKRKKFPKSLKWDRITLKTTTLSFEQAEKDFQLMNKNREFLSPRFDYMENMNIPENQFDNLSYAVGEVKKWNRGDYSIYLWKLYIWNISVRIDDSANKSCEIFYRLDSDYYRKWYMKEALQLLEKEVFENQGINRIFVQIEKRNVNSIKFIENCGYVCEWEWREVYYSNYFKDFWNMVYFSKLKSKYTKS